MNNSELKKVALTGEECKGHEIRIVNRFNALAIQSGGLQSLHLIQCDNTVEVSATFATSADAKTFKEALDGLLTKDKTDHDPRVYNCKFTTLVI